MKHLLPLLFLALCSCQATKKAGSCSTKTGFAIMDAGIKPIDAVDSIQGKARVPVKLVTLPVCLVCAGSGIIVGAPLVIIGVSMGGGGF